MHLDCGADARLSPADRGLDGILSRIRRATAASRDLITDPPELRELTAFFAWAAWVSIANGPARRSYTNNFPYDPLVGNVPTAGALL